MNKIIILNVIIKNILNNYWGSLVYFIFLLIVCLWVCVYENIYILEIKYF